MITKKYLTNSVQLYYSTVELYTRREDTTSGTDISQWRVYLDVAEDNTHHIKNISLRARVISRSHPVEHLAFGPNKHEESSVWALIQHANASTRTPGHALALTWHPI